MSQHNNLDFSTRAVHIGNEIDKETGAIRRPITQADKPIGFSGSAAFGS